MQAKFKIVMTFLILVVVAIPAVAFMRAKKKWSAEEFTAVAEAGGKQAVVIESLKEVSDQLSGAMGFGKNRVESTPSSADSPLRDYIKQNGVVGPTDVDGEPNDLKGGGDVINNYFGDYSFTDESIDNSRVKDKSKTRSRDRTKIGIKTRVKSVLKNILR